MEHMTVDIIIPVHKPDVKFILLMERLIKQTYPIHEIHIINTISTQDVRKMLPEDQRIRLTEIAPEEFDHGGTRAMAAEQSHADILMYMTQDAIPVNEYLVERLVKVFENKKVGAAYARQLPSQDCHSIERFTRVFNYPKESRIKSEEDLPDLGIKTFFCSNVCAAYRRSLYESLDGFESKTIFNEDMILAGKIIQSGKAVCYAADAEVIHSHNYSGMQQFRRNFDLAVSQKDHPEIFEEVKSEKEGIRLVKKTASHLLQIRRPWLVLVLVYQSGMKYLGYFLGKRYKKLPKKAILFCTMNPRYWESR